MTYVKKSALTQLICSVFVILALSCAEQGNGHYGSTKAVLYAGGDSIETRIPKTKRWEIYKSFVDTGKDSTKTAWEYKISSQTLSTIIKEGDYRISQKIHEALNNAKN